MWIGKEGLISVWRDFRFCAWLKILGTHIPSLVDCWFSHVIKISLHRFTFKIISAKVKKLHTSCLLEFPFSVVHSTFNDRRIYDLEAAPISSLRNWDNDYSLNFKLLLFKMKVFDWDLDTAQWKPASYFTSAIFLVIFRKRRICF